MNSAVNGRQPQPCAATPGHLNARVTAVMSGYKIDQRNFRRGPYLVALRVYWDQRRRARRPATAIVSPKTAISGPRTAHRIVPVIELPPM